MSEAHNHPLLAGLLPRDRTDVMRRQRIVLEINLILTRGRAQGIHAEPLIAAYAAGLRERGVHASTRQIMRWRRSYRLHGLDGLIDRRRLGKAHRPSHQLPLAFLKVIEAHWHANPDRLSVKAARRVELAFDLARNQCRHTNMEQCTLRDAELWFGRKYKPVKTAKGKGRSERL